MMVNIVAGAIIVALVAAALTHIVRAKRRGVKCIGCPDAGCCCQSTAESAASGDDDAAGGCGCHCTGQR